MGNKVQIAWAFIRNHKYACVTFVFLLIIGIIDENSLLSRYHNIRQIREMKAEIRNYTEKYNYDTERLNEMNTQPDAVKRIAREQYFMKTDNEDIFVIMKDTDEETE